MKILARPVEILIVEDNEGDVGLIEEVFEEAKIRNRLHIAEDEKQQCSIKDGREVLKEIKEYENLQNIPVIVLTTSNAEKDILGAYGLHANAYITKPLDFDQFIKVVGSIENFCIEIVRLPTK